MVVDYREGNSFVGMGVLPKVGSSFLRKSVHVYRQLIPVPMDVTLEIEPSVCLFSTTLPIALVSENSQFTRENLCKFCVLIAMHS